VGLWHNETLYRFASYTGAKTDYLHINDDVVAWLITDRLYYLMINAHRGEAVDLRGPSKVDMGVRVPEAVTTEVKVRLATRRGDHTVFEGRGRNAGLEVAGDLESLVGS